MKQQPQPLFHGLVRATALSLALMGSQTTQAADPVLAPGGVLQRFKQYNSAPPLATVSSDIGDNGTFDSQTIEPYFEFGPNGSNESGSNYGNILSGVLVPPVSGDYVFFVSGDDFISLYLSTDADPANKKLIASEPQWNNARQWLVTDRRNAANPENRSDTFQGTEWAGGAGAPITLTAGQQYYIEAIHMEGGGGDSVGVAWQMPGDSAPPANYSKPIPARYVYNLVDPSLVSVNVTSQPQSVSIEELGDASFTVAATAWKGINIQWEKAPAGGAVFSEIPGATDPTLSLKTVALSENGAKFRAVIYTFGGKAESAVATLNVSASTGPAVVKATASPTRSDVRITFSKPVDPATASTAANYTSDGGLNITGASLANESTVVLTTDLQTEGKVYNVSIKNVKDTSAAGVPVPNGTVARFVAYKLFPGGVRHDFYQYPGGVTLAQLATDIADGRVPTFTSIEPLAEYGPGGSNESGSNYGNKLSGWFTPPADGDYVWYVSGDDNIALYLSTDADPANKKLIAREPSWNNARQWTVTSRRNAAAPENRSDTFEGTEWDGGAGAPITLSANQAYYFEALHQEGGGGDSVGITFKLAGEDDPANGSEPALNAENSGVYENPESLFLNLVGQPASQTVQELGTATFSVQANAPYLIRYQWQKAPSGGAVFDDIAGETSSTLVIRDAALADSGSKYRCTLKTFGNEATSEAATLTVTADKTAPVVSCTAAGGGLSTIFITFSERVTAETAQNVANYKIAGVTVQGALLGSGRDKVILTTSPLTAGSTYTVVISGIKDISSAGNVILVNSTASVVAEAASYSDALLADGPILYFNFNDAPDATTAVNLGSLGDQADGTYNGTGTIGDEGPRPPDFVGFGSDNGAPTFNGTDSYVSTAGKWLNGLPAFSLEYWVKPTAFTASRVGIVGQNDAVEYGFISPNTIQIWTPGGGSLDTPYNFERDTWHHVASIGTGTQLRTYFDGELINSVNATTANYGTSSYNVNIGGGGVFDATGNYFTGQIDEVAIFDKALTADQVKSHYLAAKEGPNPAPRITSIALSNGSVLIDWVCGGTLQTSSSLTGPWSDVAGATTPYTTAANAAAAYFRMRR